MSQLILVILSFLLLEATILAGINYLPWWYKGSADIERMVRVSTTNLNQAYTLVTRANNGTPPPVLVGNPDGGLYSNFSSVLPLTPGAPKGFSWVYGKHSEDGSAYSGLNYFCLYSPTHLTKAHYQGILRAKAIYGENQAIFSGTCGDTTESRADDGRPRTGALTLYVTYIPGVTP